MQPHAHAGLGPSTETQEAEAATPLCPQRWPVADEPPRSAVQALVGRQLADTHADLVVPKRLLGAPIEHEVVEMRVSVRTGGLRLLI